MILLRPISYQSSAGWWRTVYIQICPWRACFRGGGCE